MTDKVKIRPDQVVSRKRGWISFIDANGTQVNARAAHVEVEGEPQPAAPPPVTEQAQPKVSGEETVASNGKSKTKKARKAKAEGTGVRTIGGKAVDLTKYTKVKTKGGGTSYHNGDAVAERLAGKDLDEVYAIAARVLKVEEKELRTKYKNLNVGMQRMALGNRMRKGQSAAA